MASGFFKFLWPLISSLVVDVVARIVIEYRENAAFRQRMDDAMDRRTQATTKEERRNARKYIQDVISARR
jgi:hypothetical protein